MVPVGVEVVGRAWTVRASTLRLHFVSGRRGLAGLLLRAVPGSLAERPAWAAAVALPARALLRVSTRGAAGRGRYEWYGARDLRPVLSAAAVYEGRDLGSSHRSCPGALRVQLHPLEAVRRARHGHGVPGARERRGGPPRRRGIEPEELRRPVDRHRIRAGTRSLKPWTADGPRRRCCRDGRLVRVPCDIARRTAPGRTRAGRPVAGARGSRRRPSSVLHERTTPVHPRLTPKRVSLPTVRGRSPVNPAEPGSAEEGAGTRPVPLHCGAGRRAVRAQLQPRRCFRRERVPRLLGGTPGRRLGHADRRRRRRGNLRHTVGRRVVAPEVRFRGPGRTLGVTGLRPETPSRGGGSPCRGGRRTGEDGLRVRGADGRRVPPVPFAEVGTGRNRTGAPITRGQGHHSFGSARRARRGSAGTLLEEVPPRRRTFMSATRPLPFAAQAPGRIHGADRHRRPDRHPPRPSPLRLLPPPSRPAAIPGVALEPTLRRSSTNSPRRTAPDPGTHPAAAPSFAPGPPGRTR